jgi:short-subunit dehydrogenase
MVVVSFSVEVKVVVLDMSVADFDTVHSTVAKAIDGLDVALLINNAGKGRVQIWYL